MKVGSRLNFNKHLDGVIKKASCKINALFILVHKKVLSYEPIFQLTI